MNRLRIRIEGKVREFVLEESEQHCQECVELALKRRLRCLYGLTTGTVTYIGAFAWDIYIETRKVGHAKAFHQSTKSHSCENPTLFQWILLVMAMYLALC